MSNPNAPHVPTTLPSYLGRRVLARVIDDLLLVILSIMIVVNTTIKLGDHGNGIYSTGLGGPTTDAGEGAWTTYAPLSDDEHLNTTLLAIGAFALLLFLAYAWWSSRTAGGTLGRRVAGIRVVSADGAPAPRRVIAGRELVRVALGGAALAILGPVSGELAAVGQSLVGTQFSTETGQVTAAMTAILPAALVLAAFLGAALIDPEGRAPHDRWSRTRVVRSRDRKRLLATAGGDPA
jgi:uncharacterized RDD family membrane protein YckC